MSITVLLWSAVSARQCEPEFSLMISIVYSEIRISWKEEKAVKQAKAAQGKEIFP